MEFQLKKYFNSIFKDKTIETMYIISVLLFTFKTEVSNSALIDLNPFTSRIIYLLVLLFAMPKIVAQIYTKKDICMFVLLFFLAIVCVIYSKTYNLLLIPVIIIGTKNSNIKMLVKIILYLTLTIVFIHTIAYFINSINEGINFLSLFTFKREEYRPTIMFKSHNDYGFLATSSIMQYIYITDRNKRRIIKTIFLVLYSIIIYSLGQSNTSLIISLFSIIYLFFEEFPFFNKNILLFEIMSFAFSLFFSLLFPFINPKIGIVSIIDKLLTSRIWFGYSIKKFLQISFIPQPLIFEETLPFYVDNLYLHFLYKWGIVLFIIILFIVVYLCFFQKNSSIINYFSAILFMWCIMENYPKLITVTFVPLALFNNYFANISGEK